MNGIEVKKRALGFLCRYCGAPPGQLCQTLTGRRTRETHATRWADAMKALA